MILPGIISVIIAYLLGSIPAAYIITRLSTGRDIRTLGGGNVGARNVFREVGVWAGTGVALFDVGKGVAAVAIAYRLLNLPFYESQLFMPVTTAHLFLLAAAVAVVTGHIWSVYLKFTGGNGLATTLGTLSILMWRELLIVLVLTVLLIAITRNVVLSVNMSLLSVPVSAWFIEKSWPLVVFSVVLAIILVVNFLPTAKGALVKAGSKENFLAELLRRKRIK